MTCSNSASWTSSPITATRNFTGGLAVASHLAISSSITLSLSGTGPSLVSMLRLPPNFALLVVISDASVKLVRMPSIC